MKYVVVLLLLLLLFSVRHTVFAQNSPVPSSVCLGSCPTLASPTSTFTTPTTTRTVTGIVTGTITTAPTQNPCTTTASTGTVHALKSRAPMSKGFLQQFIQFLLQLLQLIFQLFGNSSTPTPTPEVTPIIAPSVVPSTAPTIQLTGTPTVNPCMTLTPSLVPTVSIAPTTSPTSGSVPTPTIFGTTLTPSPTTSVSITAIPTNSGSLIPSGIPGTWKLVFDDEFNGSSLDTSKWAPYWFKNGSTQNNTTMVSSNVSVSSGFLNLAVTSNTGSLVSTNPNGSGHFQFTFGAMESRIYLPASGNQIANWPAWWTDGQKWPTDGEIDVMEGLHGSACYHFHSPSGGPGGCAGGNFTGWHTYGAMWQAGTVTYFYDGIKVGTISSSITSAPMYLILENSLGAPGGPKVTPATMKVDYVRVWQ